jgi:hypothetical protein
MYVISLKTALTAEVGSTSETSVNFYQIIRLNNAGHSHLQVFIILLAQPNIVRKRYYNY